MTKSIFEDDGAFRFALDEPRRVQRTGREPLDTMIELCEERFQLWRDYSCELWDGAFRVREIGKQLEPLMWRHTEQKTGGKAGLASPRKGKISFHRSGSW